MNRKTDIIIGTRYDKLIVLEMITKQGRIFWRCRCDCGKECIRHRKNLLNTDKAKRKSCGCTRNPIDMLGKKFGTFTVVKIGEYINHKRHWIVKCDLCGIEKSISGTSMRRTFTGERCSECLDKKRLCPPDMKRCNICNNVLPKEHFSLTPHHSDGRASICKDCTMDRKKVIYEMLAGAKKRSKDSGWSCELSANFLKELNEKQNGKCVYTGVKLDWDYAPIKTRRLQRNAPINRASLDRIDSSKGYTKDNVQLVAYIVNVLKNAFQEKDFLCMCALITKTAIENGKLNGGEVLGLTSHNPLVPTATL